MAPARVRLWRVRAADVRAIAAMATRDRGRRSALVVARWRTSALAAVGAALALGFGYAASRADLRLADQLAPEWEGEDIRIVGIVDDLPARYDTGVRFRALRRGDPHRRRARALAPLACVVRAARRRGRRPRGARRRALAADGSPSPAARQRQSRRLRPRSVAAAAELARDRLRARRPAHCASSPLPGAFATTCSARANRCATASWARSTGSRMRA